uniref:Uncharacterized protein n=1 Tax=Rhipicephalus zambeziensis TaxID=60191 RepID=A0A224YI33_9ACAR
MVHPDIMWSSVKSKRKESARLLEGATCFTFTIIRDIRQASSKFYIVPQQSRVIRSKTANTKNYSDKFKLHSTIIQRLHTTRVNMKRNSGSLSDKHARHIKARMTAC